MRRNLLALVLALPALSVSAEPVPAPAFDCKKVGAQGIPRLICGDASLARLDKQLAAVYAQASKKAATQRPNLLKAGQRGWVKGRDDCWKSDDKPACVRQAYVQRIVELQARYRLVEASAPARYACDGDARNELVATFFKTEPASLIAERGDSSSLMVAEPDADGAARFVGRNESLSEQQGVATVVWGYGATPMRCLRQ
jgi:uncharacterized protein